MPFVVPSFLFFSLFSFLFSLCRAFLSVRPSVNLCGESDDARMRKRTGEARRRRGMQKRNEGRKATARGKRMDDRARFCKQEKMKGGISGRRGEEDIFIPCAERKKYVWKGAWLRGANKKSISRRDSLTLATKESKESSRANGYMHGSDASEIMHACLHVCT
mmetsp:Transcript_52027/g.101889  ORF Transcript_52027/g.101889 Transcript_52027/m.101889 type:complete len:162 (+) Transcript_52027:117-602(+)